MYSYLRSISQNFKNHHNLNSSNKRLAYINEEKRSKENKISVEYQRKSKSMKKLWISFKR